MRSIWVLLLLAGCKQIFGLGEPSRAGDAGLGDDATDARIPDASTCTQASAECITDVLRTCAGPGATAVDTTCNSGCGGPMPHCFDVVPAGGGATTQDLDPDSMLGDVVLSVATVVIDGDTGAIGTTTSAESVRPAGSGTKNGISYEVTNGIAVFRFGSLQISGLTQPSGSHAIALVAAGQIGVTANIDLLAPCRGSGSLGGFAAGAGPAAGPAGATSKGGGGGGHGTPGGLGGNNAAAGTLTYGDAQVTMLEGGAGGGSAGTSAGGAGGGALQLVSGTSISITSTINAGGCGGGAGNVGTASAAGAGAGGTLLLEAPTISIPGVLAVNGGGGGGLNAGANATADRMPASGGNGGGAGAAGATKAGNGAASGQAAGGGGGGIGRIRIDTRDGMASLAGAASFSPAPTDPFSTCTVGTAQLQ